MLYTQSKLPMQQILLTKQQSGVVDSSEP